MFISLYRTTEDRDLCSWLIFERGGAVLARHSAAGRESGCGSAREIALGDAAEKDTDRRLWQEVELALSSGFSLLYCYVPPHDYPFASERIKRATGVDIVPDLRDGVPIWRGGKWRGARKPSYLLFTILSDVVM